MEVSRFELEDAMSACWSTKDDIRLVYEAALEGESSEEDIANALLGLIEIHGMRMERAFRIFEEMIRSGGIS
jgi:thymidine phosphorylase